MRQASCVCGRTVPSDTEGLAFFEERSPGTQDDRCRVCRYSKCAHEPAHMETLVHDSRTGKRRPTVVEDGRCTGFESMVEGYETDSYYCGHGGWD